MRREVAHHAYHLVLGVLLILVGICFEKLHQYHHGGHQ